jgi:hypothetical protein
LARDLDTVEVARTASIVVDELNNLFDYLAKKDPDRITKKGYKKLLMAALDLESALDSPLRDPAVDSEE